MQDPAVAVIRNFNLGVDAEIGLERERLTGFSLHLDRHFTLGFQIVPQPFHGEEFPAGQTQRYSLMPPVIAVSNA